MGSTGRLGIDRGAVYWGELIDSCVITWLSWAGRPRDCRGQPRRRPAPGKGQEAKAPAGPRGLWTHCPVSAPWILAVTVQCAALSWPRQGHHAGRLPVSLSYDDEEDSEFRPPGLILNPCPNILNPVIKIVFTLPKRKAKVRSFSR